MKPLWIILLAALGTVFAASSAAQRASAQSVLEPNKEADEIVLLTAESTTLGTYLITQDGRAVYMFTSDGPGRSECQGPCAKDWAPVTTRSEARAGAGVEAGLIGSLSTGRGDRHVSYADHPLYYF